jgi:antitoxin YefM
MDVVSYTELRSSLKSIMDKACSDHDPVIITRKSGEHMVLISLEDFKAMEETSYLLSNPHNAKRLRSSLQHSRSGAVKAFEIK